MTPSHPTPTAESLAEAIKRGEAAITAYGVGKEGADVSIRVTDLAILLDRLKSPQAWDREQIKRAIMLKIQGNQLGHRDTFGGEEIFVTTGAELDTLDRICGEAADALASTFAPPVSEREQQHERDLRDAAKLRQAQERAYRVVIRWLANPRDDDLRDGVRAFQKAYNSNDTLADWRAAYLAVHQSIAGAIMKDPSLAYIIAETTVATYPQQEPKP